MSPVDTKFVQSYAPLSRDQARSRLIHEHFVHDVKVGCEQRIPRVHNHNHTPYVVLSSMECIIREQEHVLIKM